MKISRQIGTTNEILNVFVNDVTVTTGAGLANIVASSVSFGWCRNDQATVSSGTCSSGGTLGTYNVSMLTQVNSTSTLGWYQFCPPNGIFVSGRSCLLHLYGAPNMVPVPIEIELTQFNNQAYISTYSISTMTTPVGVSSGTWVPSISSGVGVSSFAIRVGVSTAVGVSSGTWVAGVSTITTEVGVSTIVPVGVSSAQVGVSTLVGVSSGTWQVGVSTIVPVGVSSKVGVSTLVGVSTITIPVGVSSTAIEFGVSTVVPVGVSSNADKTNYTLDSTYGPAGSISTNIVQVRGIAVASGTGTSSDPWGP